MYNIYVENRYNREVRVIPVDFTEGQSVYADIQAEISDLDVAVLGNPVLLYSVIMLILISSVNNVGFFNQYPEFFAGVPVMVS